MIAFAPELVAPTFRSRWERQLGKTESPIEAAFLDQFCALALEHGYEISARRSAPAWVIVVEVQRWIDRYRADFLIAYPFFGAELSVVVECDGHDFHERTKAQARRDKARDRALQRAGCQVFRFTGSEIARDARACAAEVLDAIEEFQTATIVNAMKAAERTQVQK